MYGGLGHWKFYINEVNRIEARHSSNLPESTLSAKEIQAGFGRLYDTYPFMLPIINMEEKTGLTEEELLTWSIRKYYYRMEIYAWMAHVNKKYTDLMSPKKGKK